MTAATDKNKPNLWKGNMKNTRDAFLLTLERLPIEKEAADGNR